MTATVIAVAQSKGGAGKTTLAAHLGVAWASAGRDVAVIDTDPQGSLTEWYHRRQRRMGTEHTGIGFAAAPGWRAPGEIERQACRRDIVLIDSAPRGDDDSRAAIRCAALVLVPVQPSPVDVWATLPTLETTRREAVPALLVLNRVPARASLTAAMRALLAEYDVGLASIGIGNRIALAAAFAEGWGVAESAAGSSAAAEIDSLAQEVLGLLPQAA